MPERVERLSVSSGPSDSTDSGGSAPGGRHGGDGAVSPQQQQKSGRGQTPTATDIGKRVIFGDKKEKCGTLRYLGNPEFAPGVWCGIELDEPNGKNNGSIQGIRYFSCPSNHGLFVPLGRVELGSAVRRKTPRSSVERFRKTSTSSKGAAGGSSGFSPFFYNTLPRSTSIPALHMIDLQRSATVSSSPSKHPRSSATVDKRNVSSSSLASPTRNTSKPRKITVANARRERYEPTQYPSSLKKNFKSEMNIARKFDSDVSSSSVSDTSFPQRRFRKALVSVSDDLPSSDQRDSSNSLRSFNSCSDLKKISTAKKRISPSALYDSEDSHSHCSSISDLSRRNSIDSDSDRTPRSSSVSPDMFFDGNDDAFILTPPTSVHILSSPEGSPLHSRASGRTTATANFVDSTRPNGSVAEHRGPSPEGTTGNQRRFQNHLNGRTLEHPLVNGHSAHKRDECSETLIQQVNMTGDSLLGDQDSLDQLSKHVQNCLSQQTQTETRIRNMESTLASLKAEFKSTIKEVQETFQDKVEALQLSHQKQLEELSRKHSEQIQVLNQRHQSSLDELRKEIYSQFKRK